MFYQSLHTSPLIFTINPNLTNVGAHLCAPFFPVCALGNREGRGTQGRTHRSAPTISPQTLYTLRFAVADASPGLCYASLTGFNGNVFFEQK